MTTIRIVTAAVVLAALTAAACSPEYSRRSGYRRYHSDDEAWDIVRNDPCRYDEYRRFADEHKNPERRRDFVERLAREGCSRERYDSEPPPSYRY